MIRNESDNVITYKYKEGNYSLEDLMILVQFERLTPEQFFEITRFNYEGLLRSRDTEKGECT